MKKYSYIVALFLLIFSSCKQEQKYVNYYFDAVNGDDNNNGISVQTPFKSFEKLKSIQVNPGDSILLKSGVVFSENLQLKVEGVKDNPIVIGKYGGIEKPHIKGDGKELFSAHIFNSQYLVFRDIEISNMREKQIPGLMGLWIELKDFGEAKDIVIDNLFVHDVNGSNVIEEGGGIAICVQNARNEDEISNRFNGLTIQNCIIKDCRRDGIKIKGYWIRKQWNPNLNVLIRKNLIDGVPGDGIVTGGSDGAIIEYNVMKNSPKDLPESEACDGIWPWCSDNTLIQYNVVSDHKSIVDGYAYDSDWGCINSVFQYNLSYNNDGGFMLIIGTDGWPEDWCVNGNKETIVRYNVSINDGLRDYMSSTIYEDTYFSPVVHITGFTQNTLFENNIFYKFPKIDSKIDRTFFHFTEHDGVYGKGDIIRKNYFYAPEETVVVKEENAKNNKYQDNVFVGKLQTPDFGFNKNDGPFNKSIWYNSEDENWDKLINFLSDKTIPINGKEMKVLDIIEGKYNYN